MIAAHLEIRPPGRLAIIYILADYFQSRILPGDMCPIVDRYRTQIIKDKYKQRLTSAYGRYEEAEMTLNAVAPNFPERGSNDRTVNEAVETRCLETSLEQCPVLNTVI